MADDRGLAANLAVTTNEGISSRFAERPVQSWSQPASLEYEDEIVCAVECSGGAVPADVAEKRHRYSVEGSP